MGFLSKIFGKPLKDEMDYMDGKNEKFASAVDVFKEMYSSHCIDTGLGTAKLIEHYAESDRITSEASSYIPYILKDRYLIRAYTRKGENSDAREYACNVWKNLIDSEEICDVKFLNATYRAASHSFAQQGYDRKKSSDILISALKSNKNNDKTIDGFVRSFIYDNGDNILKDKDLAKDSLEIINEAIFTGKCCEHIRSSFCAHCCNILQQNYGDNELIMKTKSTFNKSLVAGEMSVDTLESLLNFIKAKGNNKELSDLVKGVLEKRQKDIKPKVVETKIDDKPSVRTTTIPQAVQSKGKDVHK